MNYAYKGRVQTMKKALDSMKNVSLRNKVKEKLRVMKMVTALVMTCCMVTAPINTVMAATNVTTALGVSKSDTDLVAGALAEMLLCNNNATNKFTTYQRFLTGDMQIKLRSDVDRSKEDGNMMNKAIHYVNHNNSSTKDTVIFVDCKTECERGNHMYLVEFHINKEGLIYGYNVWQY